jgi:AcrR family transcriptional regulator
MNPRSSSGTEVPSLRSRIRQATSEAILEAAEQVFADQGLHGARMNDIAQRAGMAVGTLYNHFKDRDALLAGLIEQRAGELFDEMDRVMAEEARADFRERLTATLRALFAFFTAHRPFFNLFQQMEGADLQASYPTAGQKFPEIGQGVYARFDKLAKAGLRCKALRPEAAELYPALLMGMLRAKKLCERYAGASKERAIDPALLVELFLDGAGAK